MEAVYMVIVVNLSIKSKIQKALIQVTKLMVSNRD